MKARVRMTKQDAHDLAIDYPAVSRFLTTKNLVEVVEDHPQLRKDVFPNYLKRPKGLAK